MKNLTKAIALCTMMLALSGCRSYAKVEADGNYVTLHVPLTDMNAIKSSAFVDVIYTQDSGKPHAEIYAPDNIAPLVKVEQEGGTLVIGFKSNVSVVVGKYKCEVRVFAPEVTSFTTSSSSDITLANGLKTGKPVIFKASSSGDIKAQFVECGNLVLSASSSGDVVMKHVKCRQLTLGTKSSGDIMMETVECDGVAIESSSAGDCTVRGLTCAGDVMASTRSSSDITLSGTCQNAVFSAGSSGCIYAKGLVAKDVMAKASSSGDVECNVSGVLSTDVSGAGGVRYKGSPTRVEGKVKGVSRL